MALLKLRVIKVLAMMPDTRFLTHLYSRWNDQIYEKHYLLSSRYLLSFYKSPFDVALHGSHDHRSQLQVGKYNFCLAIKRRNCNFLKKGDMFSVLCEKINDVKSTRC